MAADWTALSTALRARRPSKAATMKVAAVSGSVPAEMRPVAASARMRAARWAVTA